MAWPILETVVTALAAIPACLFVWNSFLYRRPGFVAASVRYGVSILIPARNEERSIERCVRSVLRSRNIDFEVIVVDDNSSDKTASIVQRIASGDERVRLVSSPPLPEGWCGKQHACSVAARSASKPLLCFLDADVWVAPDCIGSLANEMYKRRASLISALPYQQTETIAERVLIPLIHFILLGFLPIFGMRRSTAPSFSAGCGQLFVADAAAYAKSGGHAAIRSSRHDGIMLPRMFRRAGMMTDVCDGTGLATCRMYRNSAEVFGGLSKNATEGLAAPGRIVPFTVLLGAGQVLPFLLLADKPDVLLSLAVLLCYLPRFVAAIRFRQSWAGTLLHPIAILLLLAIQWWALIRSLLGVPSTWKGRAYSPGATP